MMSIDAASGNTMGANGNTLLLQKFLNGDTDLRSIEQRDLRVRRTSADVRTSSFDC
jgi:hypothetical protein